MKQWFKEKLREILEPYGPRIIRAINWFSIKSMHLHANSRRALRYFKPGEVYQITNGPYAAISPPIFNTKEAVYSFLEETILDLGLYLNTRADPRSYDNWYYVLLSGKHSPYHVEGFNSFTLLEVEWFSDIEVMLTVLGGNQKKYMLLQNERAWKPWEYFKSLTGNNNDRK